MSNADPHPYKLFVSYRSSRFTRPAHTVGFRSNLTGWQSDMAMTPADDVDGTSWGLWLESHQTPVQYHFKLVLDGTYWQAGWNSVATTANPPTFVGFNDDNLSWEGMTMEHERPNGHWQHGVTRTVARVEHALAPIGEGAAASIPAVGGRAAAAGKAAWRAGRLIGMAVVAGTAGVVRAAVREGAATRPGSEARSHPPDQPSGASDPDGEA